MKTVFLKLAGAFLVSTCTIALAQTATTPRPGAAGAQSSEIPLPANANVVGSGPIVMPPPAPRPGRAPARPRGDFTIHSRHLLYVTLPGSLERPMWPNGTGIVVLDADNNYAFVKRIHLWDYSGSLATDKMVWTTTLDGKCCERPQVDADGKTLVVGSNLQDYWYVLDAKTGKLIKTLHAPGSMGAHNLNLSADGKRAFMSPNGKLLQIADIETGKIVQKIQFPENVRVQALNKDSSKIYV